MFLASKLETCVGIMAAESFLLLEIGVKTGMSYYAASASFEAITNIEQEHAID